MSVRCYHVPPEPEPEYYTGDQRNHCAPPAAPTTPEKPPREYLTYLDNIYAPDAPEPFMEFVAPPVLRLVPMPTAIPIMAPDEAIEFIAIGHKIAHDLGKFVFDLNRWGTDGLDSSLRSILQAARLIGKQIRFEAKRNRGAEDGQPTLFKL